MVPLEENEAISDDIQRLINIKTEILCELSRPTTRRKAEFQA